MIYLSIFVLQDSEGYTDSFLDLPLLPLFPYEFTSCPRGAVTLLDCEKTPLNCIIDYMYDNHIYTGVKCKSKEMSDSHMSRLISHKMCAS